MDCHLYLTGYRGTGKTSVGAILAKQLGTLVIDLDQVVEANTGKTIREIFDEGGESLFRDRESEALESVCRAPSAVISLGGGAVLRPENRELIRRTGTCVWLDADPQTLADRIAADDLSADQRPRLTSESDPVAEIRQMLAQRRDLYQSASDYRIDTTGRTIQQVADEVLGELKRSDR